MKALKELLFITCVLFSVSAMSMTDMYKVIHAKGDVKMERSEVKRPVLKGDILQAGDTLTTGDNSLVVLAFGDGFASKMKITQYASIKLMGEVSDKDDRSINKKTFKLMLGNIVVDFVNKDKQKNKLKVVTKTAAMGIRGTKFFVHHTAEDETMVAVNEGVVLAKHNKDSVGTPLTSKEGMFFNEVGKSKKLTPPTWYKSINWKLKAFNNVDELFHKINFQAKSSSKGAGKALGQIDSKYVNTVGKKWADLQLEKKQENLQKLCKENDGRACSELGLYIMKHSSIKDSRAMVRNLFNKACRLKDSQGCVWSARVEHEFGDRKESIKYIQNRCEKSNDAYACYTLFEMYKRDDKDKEADEMFKKSLEIAHKLEDFDAAIADFESGCKSGYATSCTNFAILLENLGKKDKAIELYSQACDMSDGVACINLGFSQQEGGDLEKAQLNYQKACYLNENIGCYNLACVHSKKQKNDLSVQYLKLALQGGFTDWEQIEKDADLVNLRKTAEYKKLKDEFKGKTLKQ
ncbi:MAG: hypothetical protein GY909_09785 [Oligoflexia bacterium]|nr:hypothetical protein [Oligoflexia bacterium]